MKKHEKIEELIASLPLDSGLPKNVCGYILLFNQQKFYEAHDVLEDLWLTLKSTAEGNAYKALIQLAGAFVHFQKGRIESGKRLLALSFKTLEPYPQQIHSLPIQNARAIINEWSQKSEDELRKFNQLRAPRLT